ncbi:hypothetical protein FHG87_019349 [Trinorchestia longiramus]|nr:hypothetical protein FHG87_019349 [Trinorchestia longiramus]
MRINCEVTVVSRALAGTNCRQPRAVRASLGIGRAALGDNGSLCFHLCTASNRHGSKYKIVKNIDGVFTKFVSEGKFTIRLKEPKQDLIVKTDAVQAKSFLQLPEVSIKGYVLHNVDKPSHSNRGGGSLIYVKEKLQPQIKTKRATEKSEILHLNIQPHPGQTIKIVLVYRNPT